MSDDVANTVFFPSCIGTAVRIATEIQLHRSIFKALDGDRNHYLRTRLWYLVYVCDHHFSVAYGRPPMTRQCDAIRASLRFLDTEHAVEDDARLICEWFHSPHVRILKI
jgi:hypothetical protein